MDKFKEVVESNQEAERINNRLWDILTKDITNDPENFPQKNPLLAHYTSIEVFEKIIKDEEIWFSNPLFMNDIQEIRGIVLEGSRLFKESHLIARSCGSEARYQILTDAFNFYLDEFSNKHVLDIYAFCLSEHDMEDHQDGRLSMWRGYGGNGRGVAIVFDLEKLQVVPGSPMVISRVQYISESQRQDWINEKLLEVCSFLDIEKIPDSQLFIVAYILFERFKLCALFTKHQGFKEEKEWRVVYMKDRDVEGKFPPVYGHIITGRGVEPKLRYQFKPIAGATEDDFSLNKLVHSVILGPMVSDRLAYESLLRMLDNVNKKEIKSKIRSSTIPYRSIS